MILDLEGRQVEQIQVILHRVAVMEALAYAHNT